MMMFSDETVAHFDNEIDFCRCRDCSCIQRANIKFNESEHQERKIAKK